MGVLKIVIQIIFIILCIALTVLVLMQEGKSAGLGAISGAAETYWGKNKGRSMEGKLVKLTKYLAIGFMLLTIILNLNVFCDLRHSCKRMPFLTERCWKKSGFVAGIRRSGKVQHWLVMLQQRGNGNWKLGKSVKIK